ncbi:MAG: peptidoglycan-associated lipoprotein Pal [Gemmatimonadota bacterium]|nr:peptidoglycan-associated lipoprotein Pal [Gemmatimonadota bacterium]MDH3427706.1 peptidoglycan-associated lipoprotein Pal [Gemmatimonadota bacterium]
MHRNTSIAALLVLIGAGAVACGGAPPPPEPPPVVEAAPTPDPDSIAAARAAEREAAAMQLCEQATAAVAAGDVNQARSLVQQINRDYAGTECANMVAGISAKIDAIVVLRERVHFEFDRSRITDEAAAVLQRKAEVLRAHPDLRITIEGHCDERGSLEYNMALGQRRAQSTVRYLTGLGISGDMFSTVSYGEERPVAQGADEGAWAQNRRAEFVIGNLDAL